MANVRSSGSSGTPPRPIASAKLKRFFSRIVLRFLWDKLLKENRENPRSLKDQIMNPGPAASSQNRSCSSPASQCQSASPSLVQQPQQHLIYGPITTIQPYLPTNVHPHCVYTDIQRNPGLAGTNPLSSQVSVRHTKVTKWQPKGKPSRIHQGNSQANLHKAQQQYCQSSQHSIHQPISYIPKPVVVFDQCQSNSGPGIAPAGTPFLVASSSFAHGPYGSIDHFPSPPGVTLIPQPYFKPSEVGPTFCLLPERPGTTQALGGQSQAPLYNISAASPCNISSIHPKSSFLHGHPYGNVASFGNGQINSGPTPTNQLFPNSSITFNAPSREKLSMLSSVDVQTMTYSRDVAGSADVKQDTADTGMENLEWPLQTARDSVSVFETSETTGSPRILTSPIQTARLCASKPKSQDERFSDESASFDFTIEAEKMVSALCNTVSSNELGKDETHGKNEASMSSGGAAGDNITNKTNIWFTDFCTDYGVPMGQSYRTASTQTQEDRQDPQHNPEMMRKTINWGCNEAETILNSICHRSNSRAGFLANISCATRTAVAKSSTCFPVFSGDKNFVRDLINAFLRISNGWLILDNYLNKQHYPSLDEKFDRKLTSCFQTWESASHDLLEEIVKALNTIEENAANSSNLDSVGFQEGSLNNSFPGDVNLYTNNDLFDSSQRQQESNLSNSDRNDRDSTYTLSYPACGKNLSNFESKQKEPKLRSKWTITENLSTIDGGKSEVNKKDASFGSTNRFRLKNACNAKITSSKHSLNAEFFHLRNKVMESIGNGNEPDRHQWGLKEHFLFGASSRSGVNSSAIIASGSCEPAFKIRGNGTAYENSYERRCPAARLDPTIPVNQPNHCTNLNGSIYLLTGSESDSTYVERKTYPDPDYAGRISELGELGNAGISSLKSEPVYVSKCSSDQRELVPRTKMTLLSQIEGNTLSRDTKEMTANLSAWFARMRNSPSSHRTISSTERKIDNRASTHPQETSRSAMDLNRQLHLDANRQLATLQNMQAIQSQPWNAANLLKRTNGNVYRGIDEYDSSEDVRVYMKPGSYNVPKKRHHRRNLRKSENPSSSRGNNTPRIHNRQQNYHVGKNQVSSSISSVLIASSVQLSTTTTTTTTSIQVPFPATPIVPPPSNFTPHNSPRILRRVNSLGEQESRQDVAWKAACASAEILLEALNVKTTNECQNLEKISESPRADKNNEASNGNLNESTDRLCNSNKPNKMEDDIYHEVSSYEPSEDGSSSTCKYSPERKEKSGMREFKQSKTNIKTDSWLIRTFSNANVADLRDSDPESTIGGSINSSLNEDRRELKAVVTSTPEPAKVQFETENAKIAIKKPAGAFPEKMKSPRKTENLGESELSNKPTRNLSISLIDTSEEFVGRATYSETVRRSTGKIGNSGKSDNSRTRQMRSTNSMETMRTSVIPIPSRKCQRKDDRLTCQSHKCRKTIGKRLSKDFEDSEERLKKIVREESSGECTRPLKSQRKKEDGMIETRSKAGERGWSIWYSSKRKQSLSTPAFNKLVTIHQTVWQMEDAKLLKQPSISNESKEIIDDESNAIKSPMFLETIGYKLKNRIYHKIEHVMRDFRKIVNNSKLYHKNDVDCIAKIESLWKKLVELFDEQFANWEVENANESPKNTSGSLNSQGARLKSPQKQQEKSTLARENASLKKNSSGATKNEN